MSIPKDLAAIRETDLLSLIEQPVMEDKSTEYKEALTLQNDEAKRKFLAGIASFANASGGDLIYGMKANDGLPPVRNHSPTSIQTRPRSGYGTSFLPTSIPRFTASASDRWT